MSFLLDVEKMEEENKKKKVIELEKCIRDILVYELQTIKYDNGYRSPFNYSISDEDIDNVCDKIVDKLKDRLE